MVNGVEVGIGVEVLVVNGVLVGTGVEVLVGTGVLVEVVVRVGVLDGVIVEVAVFVGVFVLVFVALAVLVGVREGVRVNVGVEVSVDLASRGSFVLPSATEAVDSVKKKTSTSSMAALGFVTVILINLAYTGSNVACTVSEPEITPLKPLAFES
jgi:hypothetical protein